MIPTESAVCGRVSDLRKFASMSQADLAEAVGLTRDKLANIETGRTILGFWAGWKLCQVLDVNQRYLAIGSLPVKPFLNFNPLEIEKPVPESASFLRAYLLHIGRDVALRLDLLESGQLSTNKDNLDFVKTACIVGCMSSKEVPTWAQLKKTIAQMTSGHGQKAALADELGVSRQVLGNWLSDGEQGAPNAELTLRLFKWSLDPKRQQAK